MTFPWVCYTHTTALWFQSGKQRSIWLVTCTGSYTPISISVIFRLGMAAAAEILSAVHFSSRQICWAPSSPFFLSFPHKIETWNSWVMLLTNDITHFLLTRSPLCLFLKGWILKSKVKGKLMKATVLSPQERVVFRYKSSLCYFEFQCMKYEVKEIWFNLKQPPCFSL